MRFKAIKEKGFEIASTPNFVDMVWGDLKPARPNDLIKVYPAKKAGMNPFAKYALMCEALGSIDYLLVTALD